MNKWNINHNQKIISSSDDVSIKAVNKVGKKLYKHNKKITFGEL